MATEKETEKERGQTTRKGKTDRSRCRLRELIAGGCQSRCEIRSKSPISAYGSIGSHRCLQASSKTLGKVKYKKETVLKSSNS